MHVVVTSVRRLVWLMLLSAIGGAAYAYWRDRGADDVLEPAEWPPVVPEPASDAEPERQPDTASDPTETSTWVEPLDDGSCPVGYPIKANDNSGIFHVPEGRFYARTKAERCYASPDAAVADGYRQSKS